MRFAVRGKDFFRETWLLPFKSLPAGYAVKKDRVAVGLFGQFFAGLVTDYVLGVPVWPVLVALPAGALLVFAVGRRRTTRSESNV